MQSTDLTAYTELAHDSRPRATRGADGQGAAPAAVRPPLLLPDRRASHAGVPLLHRTGCAAGAWRTALNISASVICRLQHPIECLRRVSRCTTVGWSKRISRWPVFAELPALVMEAEAPTWMEGSAWGSAQSP